MNLDKLICEELSKWTNPPRKIKEIEVDTNANISQVGLRCFVREVLQEAIGDVKKEMEASRVWDDNYLYVRKVRLLEKIYEVAKEWGVEIE